MTFKKYIKLLTEAHQLVESSQDIPAIISHFNDVNDESFEDIESMMSEYELSEIIDDTVDMGMNYVESLLEYIDIDHEVHILPNKSVLMHIPGHGALFNDQFNDDVDDIIYSTWDDRIMEMFNYDPTKWSNGFWKQVNDMAVYHATTEDKWEDIQSSGVLEARRDSRGLTNNNTGSAVFVTTNEDQLHRGTYGNVHLSISLGDMKRDGFMPMVSEEEPTIVDKYRSSLAHMLGKEYSGDTGDGIDLDTLVIFGDIPLKYVTRINH